MVEALKQIRHVALDLDGTVYTGGTVFDYTLPFLKTLKSLGIGYSFLTNNSSQSSRDYAAHLGAMGIEADVEDIFTSGDATIEYLREEMPEVRRLFLLGTQSLSNQFASEGYTICDGDPAEVPEAVVVAFDTALVYERLCQAAYWIERGLPFVATHPDRVCPTNRSTVLVDCGSICAALERATGREPTAVPGKPNSRMLRGILGRHHLKPFQLAMVGDRLYTDIRMARESGALGVLVLSGETTVEQVASIDEQPDVIVHDLDELGQLFRKNWRLDDAQFLLSQRRPRSTHLRLDS